MAKRDQGYTLIHNIIRYCNKKLIFNDRMCPQRVFLSAFADPLVPKKFGWLLQSRASLEIHFFEPNLYVKSTLLW
jgi:hypothetical protein